MFPSSLLQYYCLERFSGGVAAFFRNNSLQIVFNVHTLHLFNLNKFEFSYLFLRV